MQLVAESRSCAGREGVSIAPEVSQLVDYIWTEANGQLEEMLASPIESFKTEQVEKAEAALMSLKEHLTKTDTDQKERDSERLKLEAEFYSSLPHKPPHKVAIDSMRVIAQKQDLCQVCCHGNCLYYANGLVAFMCACCMLWQLVKDVVSVSEATNWSTRGSAEAKYRALRCDIQMLDPSSYEYSEVQYHIQLNKDELVSHI